MTRDVNPLMLQTLQATAVSYVESSNRQRSQREETLRQYIKQIQPQDDTPAVNTEQTQVILDIPFCALFTKLGIPLESD